MVGGYKATIHPYRRNRNLGTEENMDKLVMKGVPSISHDPHVKRKDTMFGSRYKIAHEPYGITYSFYYFEKYMVIHYSFETSEAYTPCVKLLGRQQRYALGGNHQEHYLSSHYRSCRRTSERSPQGKPSRQNSGLAPYRRRTESRRRKWICSYQGIKEGELMLMSSLS